MPTKEDLDKLKSGRKQRRKYPRFNLQAGETAEQIFRVKLLRRLKAKTDICDGFFYEYGVHYSCGPDRDQSLICLNEGKEAMKTNKDKCPACSATRKVLRNKDEFTENEQGKAKKQACRGRVNWPVYDLDKRKNVEMLELGSRGLDDLLDVFKDSQEEYLDLTDHLIPCALQIHRKGKGEHSRYFFKALQGDKYKLTGEDAKNIKATYLAPESVVERLNHEEFQNIFSGEFGVDSGDTSDLGGVEDTQTETKQGKKPANDDLAGLGGVDGGGDTQEQPVRTRPGAVKKEEKAASPDGSDASLLNELEALGS